MGEFYHYLYDIIMPDELPPAPFCFLFFAILLLSCLLPARILIARAPPIPPAAYIENKGSDTIVNLALAWAERYQGEHPDIRISVTGGGSGTGLAALINGTVDIANASRQIKDEEIAQAQTNGIQPVEHIIARDAIAVIVNPDNPVSELTLQQISDIYSGKINNWKEVGGEDRPIVRLSRETNSGTHVYFLETVLRLGEQGRQNSLFDGHAPASLLGRHHRRSTATIPTPSVMMDSATFRMM